MTFRVFPTNPVTAITSLLVCVIIVISATKRSPSLIITAGVLASEGIVLLQHVILVPRVSQQVVLASEIKPLLQQCSCVSVVGPTIPFVTESETLLVGGLCDVDGRYTLMPLLLVLLLLLLLLLTRTIKCANARYNTTILMRRCSSVWNQRWNKLTRLRLSTRL